MALKFLEPALAAALGAERFQREIVTTANLRHPHILPLYDSGEIAGPNADTLFCYVMPFVEGESLRGRLVRDGQLPVDEALRIVRDVADALGYAHDLGIVHRDIKPENILLDHGRAVVADFGIARAVSLAGDARLTQTGLVVGSPMYMSPEQSVGDDVDGRSDLYALGCVLYEMLAGEPPYTVTTAHAIIAKRFRDPVPRVSALRPDVSPALDELVLRALAPSPADRFANARDLMAAIVAHDLHPTSAVRQGSAGPAPDEFRIAVTPFRFAADQGTLASLAEGLADGVVTGLLRFPWLRVIVATSPGDGPPGASPAPVRFRIDGALRQSGTRIRLTVQLLDVAVGGPIWAETYDRQLGDDSFALVDDLVARIVSTCGDHFGVLARTICDSVRTRPPATLTAYEALMRGFGYHLRLTPEEHAVARDALEAAVQRVPNSADCLAMLAWVTSHEVAHGFNPRPASLDRALALARRAVDLAPTNHLAHQALAVAQFFRRETAACLAAAERAIALNPLDGSNEAFFLLCFTGHWDRGIPLIREAIDRNPHHPRWYEGIIALNEFRLGHHRAAADQCLRANAREIFWFNVFIGAALGQLGDPAAHEAIEMLLAQKPDFATSGEQMMAMWYEPSLVSAVTDGLRKAGLELMPRST